METTKLYYRNSHDIRCEARVISCEGKDGAYEIVLDRTPFFPGGGGQPSDTGAIDCARVTNIREADGIIYHTADKPLEAGRIAECAVDFPRRFDFMQQHTGEHIVSGLLYKMFGVVNKSFHIGADYMTIDTNRPVTEAELHKAETEANRAVYANIPVNTFFPSPDEMAVLDYRTKLDEERLFGYNIRMVEIKGVDMSTCCGVLCMTTGEVGAVKITDASSYKGGSRIILLCGERAMTDYYAKNRDVYALSAILSAKPNEVIGAVNALRTENSALKNHVMALKKTLFEEIINTITPGQQQFIKEIDGLSADDLRRLAIWASERAAIASVFTGDGSGSYKYAIASKTENASAYAQMLLANLERKGGGNERLAQGTLRADYESASQLLNFLKNRQITGASP